MSAICGIIRTDGAPVDRADLQTMIESMPYRGPDGQSEWLEGNAGLAHLAFHVTPESRQENQPVISADGDLVLVADVRLDNRDELAGKLQPDGADFRALTDPELLLEAYRRWETACLEHLLGDFVFAVWHRKAKKLFLARDPLGNFGVTVHKEGAAFFFASEIAAILDLPQVTPAVNENAVIKTLATLSLDLNESFFHGIHALPPAHYLELAEDRLTIRRYWDIDPERDIRYRSDQDYTEHFIELLTRSVMNRTRTFGPVGISLSGGFDSTLLAAIAARHLSRSGQSLSSFSNVFDTFTECDEREYIEPVVKQYGLDATLIPSDGFWTFADLARQAIPRDFFWTNSYARLPRSIAEAAAGAGCRVLIDGMAGDALFGEPSLFAADLIRQMRFGTLARLLWGHRQTMSWRTEIIDHGLRQLLPATLRGAYRSLVPVRPRWPVPGLTQNAKNRLETILKDRSEESPAALTPARRVRYRAIFDPSWSMGFAATRGFVYHRAGIEAVSPYSDRRLVEFVLAIPAEQVGHAGSPRKLQRDAMRRLLPEKLHTRESKTRFLPLLHEGVVNRERHSVIADVSESLAVERGWIDRAWLETQLKKPSAVQRDGYFLSRCLSLELWLRASESAGVRGGKWSDPYFHTPGRQKR